VRGVPRGFFARPAAAVAQDLLGLVLAHRTASGEVAVRLVETEAYAGQADPASHAFRGPTARNAVMFGEPGHCYVYFIYGMHFCANLVCQPAGQAAAVLLRAGEVVRGADLAAARRAENRSRVPAAALARGPASLCQALGIGAALNGADVCDPGSLLRLLVPAGHRPLAPGLIGSGPRVGIKQAAERPWRFWIADDPAVSSYRPHAPRRQPPATDSAPAAPGGRMQR
jgi:DNA-3-methyladenine glycosylase